MNAPSPNQQPNPGWFRKGQSGNRSGRPRKAAPAPASAFDVIVEQKLTVTRGLASHEISIEEALQHRTYQEALAGKRLAQRQVLKWIEKREAWLTEHRPKHAKPPITVLTDYGADNANEALLLLGVARANPDPNYRSKDHPDLKLESWAVQAALKRRRRPLTEAEVAQIRRCSLNGETLRLPKGVAE